MRARWEAPTKAHALRMMRRILSLMDYGASPGIVTLEDVRAYAWVCFGNIRPQTMRESLHFLRVAAAMRKKTLGIETQFILGAGA
jgi:hypothetical protein